MIHETVQSLQTLIKGRKKISTNEGTNLMLTLAYPKIAVCARMNPQVAFDQGIRFQVRVPAGWVLEGLTSALVKQLLNADLSMKFSAASKSIVPTMITPEESQVEEEWSDIVLVFFKFQLYIHVPTCIRYVRNMPRNI